MPTKSATHGNETHLESDNVARTVKVESNWVGTAIDLLRALEESDEEIGNLSVGTDLGEPKVTVRCKDGAEGEAAAVPEGLHAKLTEYDYHHVGEGGDASYTHTDERFSHVYIKED